MVPSPAFRSTSLGIILAVVFVLAATLTLLPAVLAKLGPRVDRFSLGWVESGEHRSPRFAAWSERLWRRPLPYGLVAIVLLVALALPVLSLKTGMPSIKVVPSGDNSRQGYYAIQKAFGPGSTGPLQIVAPKAQAALVGGPVAENHDLETALSAKTPLVIGVVLGLGFLLLVVAVQAPLIAAAAVVANLLATGAQSCAFAGS